MKFLIVMVNGGRAVEVGIMIGWVDAMKIFEAGITETMTAECR